jgi:hypothetical protein
MKCDYLRSLEMNRAYYPPTVQTPILSAQILRDVCHTKNPFVYEPPILHMS